MERTVAVVTLLFALSVMVLAHGKEKHVMGKVTSTSDNSITVETTSKQSVTVEVNDKTKFEKSGAAATLNISDNGGGSPQRVSLSGTGVAGRCSPRGTQCAPQFPPCCPGLKCTFLGNRAFCEP